MDGALERSACRPSRFGGAPPLLALRRRAAPPGAGRRAGHAPRPAAAGRAVREPRPGLAPRARGDPARLRGRRHGAGAGHPRRRSRLGALRRAARARRRASWSTPAPGGFGAGGEDLLARAPAQAAVRGRAVAAPRPRRGRGAATARRRRRGAAREDGDRPVLPAAVADPPARPALQGRRRDGARRWRCSCALVRGAGRVRRGRGRRPAASGVPLGWFWRAVCAACCGCWS